METKNMAQINFQRLIESSATIGDIQRAVEHARGLEGSEGVMIQILNTQSAREELERETNTELSAEQLVEELIR